MLADAFQLKHAVLNLVLNALQATPAGGAIAIETGGDARALEIRVRDSGEGMTEDVLARVFDAFFTTREGGTGLGLPIARRIVEAHGGTLTLRSRDGRGHGGHALAAGRPRGTLMRTILLVEDHAESRSSLAWVLEKNGYAVRQAANGRAALAAARREKLHALILDLKLPDMEGAAVLDAVLEQHPGLPAIVVTGFGTVDTAVEAMKRGATDFLTKPIDIESLLATLAREIERASASGVVATPPSRAAAEMDQLGIIGHSRAMLELFDTVKRLARHQSTILILGESGTGKELIARALHSLGPRRDGPFVAVNCATLVRAAAGERALRPRAGRLHERGSDQGRGDGDGRRGHALPRRGQRDGPRLPGQAPPGPRAARVPPRRRHPQDRGRHPPPRGEQRRPRGARREPAASAPTSTTASRSSRSPSRRCGTARTRSRCWRSASSRTWRGTPASSPEEADAGRPGPARPLPLAGQHPRAAQLHGEPHAHQPAGGDRRRRPARRTCARLRARPRSACAVGTRMEDAEREIIRRTVEAYPTLKDAARVLGIGLRTLHTKLRRYQLGAPRGAPETAGPAAKPRGLTARECRNGTPSGSCGEADSAESARSRPLGHRRCEGRVPRTSSADDSS